MGAAVLLGSLRSGRAGPGRSGARAGRLRRSSSTTTRRTRRATSLFTPVLFAVAWLVGLRAAGASRAEPRPPRSGRVRAERERESAARVAVAEERARMARELHDVVAHAVSVMVLQVGAVRHRMPAGVRGGRGAEERRAGRPHGARGDAPAARRAAAGRRPARAHAAPRAGRPATRWRGDVRAAGLDVRLHVDGEPVALPRSLDLSAYRIVQEGLTNALKHSGGRRADVTVDVRARPSCGSRCATTGRAASRRRDGFGHGLIGIGERVKATAGTCRRSSPPRAASCSAPRSRSRRGRDA